MKSKTLCFFIVGVLMVCLFGGGVVLAQPQIVIDGGTIVCKEEDVNGVVDSPGDSLIVTVRAVLPNGGSYPLCEPDSVEAGLWPVPGLGDFDYTMPQINYLCNPVQQYRMNVMVIQNMGLDTLYDEDSCLAIATVTLHPVNLVAESGTIAQFSVTVKSASNCWPCRYCRSDPMYVALPCFANTGGVPPPAILDLVVRVQDSDIILNWSVSGDAEGYHVYRSSNPFGSHDFLGATSDTTYTDVGAAAASKYFYRVRASN